MLGIDRVTVVGHSFGGGVAMQFAYQYPERTERLVLVAPGGLGPEVTPVDPGDHHARVPPGDAVCSRCRACATSAIAGLRALSRSRLPPTARPRRGRRRSSTRSRTPRTRAAIRHVVRAVVDWKGQIITMVDRAYLTEAMPMCVIWGDDDQVIPTRHAERGRRGRARTLGSR